MSNDHNKTTVQRPIMLTPSATVPVYVVGSAICLAVYMTVLYDRAMGRIDNALTVGQAQQWVDAAREANLVAYPMFRWPPIPPRLAHSKSTTEPMAAASFVP